MARPSVRSLLAAAPRLSYVTRPAAGGPLVPVPTPHRPVDSMCKLALLALAAAITLMPSREAGGQTSPRSPCSDSLYLTLKQKPVDSLSTREYELFRDRDRACLQSAGTQSATSSGAAASSDASGVAVAVAEGRELAESEGMGGWFAGGVASGLVLGLIGTAVITIAANNTSNNVPASQQSILATKPPDYSQAFARGYREKLKSKKRASALTGGLLGTAVVLVIYASAQAGE